MDADETPTQTPPSRSADLKVIGEKLGIIVALWAAVLGLLIPLVDVLFPLDQETRRRIVFVIYACLVVITSLIWFKRPLVWVHRRLSSAVPWFVLVLLLLSGVTLYVVRLLRTPEFIAINLDLGQIFNSWQDKYSGHTQHIRAWGTEQDPQFWDTADRSPDQAAFSYEVDPKLQPSDGASSGGYKTFYYTPADRRIFQHLIFTLQSAETCGAGKADVRSQIGNRRPSRP
jgi:hypothetical protein